MKLAKNPRRLAGGRIYMDYSSGTPLDGLGNPGGLHKEGLNAKKILEDARARVARVLSARPREIIFTSSGTEANNLAILGVISGGKRSGFENSKRPNLEEPVHIITTNIEHASVLETCKFLENPPSGGKRAEVTYIPVEKNGIVDPKKIKTALKKNTVLVSVMYANNEIGTVQPIREIAKIIRYYRKSITPPNPPLNKGRAKPARSAGGGGVYFHTDAIQAANYLDIRPEFLGADLLTLNGSKIYGPRGTGMLYVRHGIPLAPIFFGGDQEFGLRPGTENVVAIAGFAEALDLTQGMRAKESKRLTKLRDYFYSQILKNLRIVLNGDPVARLPNNINFSVPGVESEMLVLELDAYGIAVSSKSACKSGSEDTSHVLKAINPKAKKEEGAIRVSLGRDTTKADIDYLLKSLRVILAKLTRQKLWY